MISGLEFDEGEINKEESHVYVEEREGTAENL